MHALPGRALAVVFVAAGLIVVADSGGLRPAEAGGGCRGIPSTAGSGDNVQMAETCFLPTVLHVAPGTTVSFENASTQPHSVSGATLEWGNYNNLGNGETARYTFARPGTYPYYCFVHNGMTGAIVVGDGVVPESTSPQSPVEEVSQRTERVESPGAVALAPVAKQAGHGDTSMTLFAGLAGAIGGAVAVMAGLGIVSLRKR